MDDICSFNNNQFDPFIMDRFESCLLVSAIGALNAYVGWKRNGLHSRWKVCTCVCVNVRPLEEDHVGIERSVD